MRNLCWIKKVYLVKHMILFTAYLIQNFYCVTLLRSPLFDVKAEQTIDTAPCTSFLRVNVNSTIAMCSEATYVIESSGFSILYQGPINRLATPLSNLTVTFNGNYVNDPNCLSGNGGALKIYNGTQMVKEVSLSAPGNHYAFLLHAFIMEDTPKIKLVFAFKTNKLGTCEAPYARYIDY